MDPKPDQVWVLEGFQNQSEVMRWELAGINDEWVRKHLGLTGLAADLWDVPEQLVLELKSKLDLDLDQNAFDYFLIGREQAVRSNSKDQRGL